MGRGTGILLVLWALAACTSRPKYEPISPALQKEIDYGRELIVHTAQYLGPQGSVAKLMGSRMNCQNCHLDGGRKPYGISFESVHARYPDYRAREGKVLTLVDRINNCVERPMNGKPIPPESREMRAMLAYFAFLARGVPVGSRIVGDRLNDMVHFPTRPADPEKGRLIFEAKCVSCHGADGQGKLNAQGNEFIYPPLWGPESFNAGSNMHRVIKLAAFIKANMPLGATYNVPLLTDTESFDVAAFVVDGTRHSRPPSHWADFPNVAEKPIDFPKGPYADGFSEAEHKYGPFRPIIESLQKQDRVAYY